MATKDNISVLTEQDKKSMLDKSVKVLPSNPSDKGYSVQQIKQAQYEPSVILFNHISTLITQLKTAFDVSDASVASVLAEAQKRIETKKSIYVAKLVSDLGNATNWDEGQCFLINNQDSTPKVCKIYQLISGQYEVVLDLLGILESAKDYTDDEVALLETKADALLKLAEAKSYTDNHGSPINKIQISSTDLPISNKVVNIQLADSTHNGAMSKESVIAIQSLTSDVSVLKGQNVRLLYTAGNNPTSQQIQTFVTTQGYTDQTKWAYISVVIKDTNHIWRCTSSGNGDNVTYLWSDFGLDTVSQFTNSVAGVIKGSATAGKVYAEDDGTGSVYGWDALNSLVSGKSTVSGTGTDKWEELTIDGVTKAVGGGSSYTAGTGIDITNNTISVNSDVVKTSENQTISGTKTFNSAPYFNPNQGITFRLDGSDNNYVTLSRSDAKTLAIADRDYHIYWFTPTALMNSNNANLGSAQRLWNNLYLAGNLSDGTNSVAISNIATKTEIETLKANAFKKVDTTTYPTLNDFLASTGEEGFVYLYPIDTTDLTKGYYQYIWENSTWLSIGTTKIDLSGYPTKAGNETITGNWTFSSGLKINDNTSIKVTSENTDVLVFSNPYSLKMVKPIPMDSNQDIGSSSNKWKDLYLSGTVYVGTISPSADDITIGKSTGLVQFQSKIRPIADNARDIGDASHRIKSLYLGTSLILNGTTIKEGSFASTVADTSSTTYSGALASNKDYTFATALTSVTISSLDVQDGDNQPQWAISFIVGSSFAVTLPTGCTWAYGTPTFNQGESYSIVIKKGLVANTYKAYLVRL